jgi:TolB-like protein
MLKKRFFVILTIIVGIILVTACASNSSNSTAVSSSTTSTTAKPAETSGYKTLDQAIKEAAGRIDEQLSAGTKIAILSINSSSDQFSIYVIDELTANFLDTRKLMVIDRKEIDLIRGELNFQFSGEVSDDSMQAVGKMLGAQTIVSGSLMEIGDTYRIVIRALSVQTATVEVQYRTDIANDNRVRALLATGKSNNGGNINVSNRTNTIQKSVQPVKHPAPDNAVIWQETGNRYLLVDQSMTWDEANRYARDRGGYLAIISNANEQKFVQNLIMGGNKNFYWLGGYRDGNTWKWLDGSYFGYTNWFIGRWSQPDNKDNRQDKLIIMRIPNPAFTDAEAVGKWDDCGADGLIRGEEYFAATNKGLIIEWDK